MLGFFKVFAYGVVCTILFPLIALVWALFGVYCVILFIILLFRNLIVAIRGGSPFGDTKEDLVAKKILIERQQGQQNNNNPDIKDQLIETLLNTVKAQQQQQQGNAPRVEPQTYDVFPTDDIKEIESTDLDHYLEENNK